MKISLDELKSLPQPRLEISFNEKLEESTQAVKPVVGELTVTAGATGMRLTGRVQTLLKLSCDRCLRPYFQSITVDLNERFVLSTMAEQWDKNPQKELTRAEDFAETLLEGDVLDITDVVYQAVTLAVPSVCNCGSECPGPAMPAKTSKKASLGKAKDGRKAEAPIDPRWKNLKTLFPNDDRETKS